MIINGYEPIWGPDTTTGAAEIICPLNIALFPDFIIAVDSLGHGSGTPDFLVQLSDDNGSTWDTTNYISYGLTGSSGFIFATAVPTTATAHVSAHINILFAGLAMPTRARINGGRDNASGGARQLAMRNSTSDLFNRFKILNSTATNFTANSGVTVFAKM